MKRHSARAAALVLTLAIGAAALSAAPAAATAPTAGARAAAQAVAGAPDWRAWNDGMKQASTTGRPVVVDVYTNWCGWCRRMDRDVYQNAEIADYLRKKFVTIKLNAEAKDGARWQSHDYTSQDLAQQFRVSGYPTTIFLRSSGEHMANVPGYVAADRFLLLLRYVAEGYADRNVPFAEFEKNAERGR